MLGEVFMDRNLKLSRPFLFYDVLQDHHDNQLLLDVLRGHIVTHILLDVLHDHCINHLLPPTLDFLHVP